MGNIDAPFGLKPVGHLSGADWNGITRRCYCASTYATALYVGDACVLTATAADRDPTGVHLSVQVATVGNGNYITGAITGFEPTATYQTLYRAASTLRYANVCVDPTVVFDIRDDGSGTPTSYMPGANAVLIATHSGSTTTGLSGMELDMSSDVPAADASNQLIILGVAPYPDNVLGDFAIWRVMINLHTFRSTGDGDGSLGVLAS